MSGLVPWISLGLSAVAIVVAMWTNCRSHKLQSRVVKMEETREKDRLIEQKKASLTARIVREPGGRNMRDLLVIENLGSGEARNISAMLDGKPLLEHPAILQKERKLDEIGPRSAVKFLLFTADQLKPPNKITITWEDDSGQPGKYNTTLTL